MAAAPLPVPSPFPSFSNGIICCTFIYCLNHTASFEGVLIQLIKINTLATRIGPIAFTL